MKFCEIIKSNPELLKLAFISAESLKQAGAMPAPGGGDPNAGGAMPPPPPPGMDPNAGAMPPPPPGMDPNMPPPPPEGGAPEGGAPEGPSPDEMMSMLEEMAEGMKQYEQEVNSLKTEMQNIKIKFAEAMTTVNNVLDILNKGSIQAPKVPTNL